jgi:hypothetical protein
MYMRIIWGKIRPGQWTQYEEAYKKVLRPGKEHIRGLKGGGSRGISVIRTLAIRSAFGNPRRRWTGTGPAIFSARRSYLLSNPFVDDFTTAHCEVRVKEEFAA